MTSHSIESLMKLLANLTGWSDQSLDVSIGYRRARVFTAQDESFLDPDNAGFVVATTLCGGSALEIDAQGRTLPEALIALAEAIVHKLDEQRSYYADRGLQARRTLVAYDPAIAAKVGSGNR